MCGREGVRRDCSQAREREEKRVWFLLFVHALNSGGIPPAPWMFVYVCTLVVSKRILNITTALVLIVLSPMPSCSLLCPQAARCS